MGTLAQIDKVTLLVKRNLGFIREVINQANLKGLRQLLAALARLFTRLRPTHHRQICLYDLTHPGFNRRKVILRKLLWKLEVVEKAIVDDRTDTHLGLWHPLTYCLGEDVRRGVAHAGNEIGWR